MKFEIIIGHPFQTPSAFSVIFAMFRLREVSVHEIEHLLAIYSRTIINTKITIAISRNSDLLVLHRN